MKPKPSDEKALHRCPITDSAFADGTDHGDTKKQDDDERQGRFYGPDATWRYITREDRKVANSLDQAECNDLGLHLYNTHAWKQRFYPSDGNLRALAWQSKLSWVEADENGDFPFRPPAQWTAWPLHPEDVPRRREIWGAPTVWPGDDPKVIVKTTPWQPSQDLKEELQAILLREAHKKFQARFDHHHGNTTVLTDTGDTLQSSSQSSLHTSISPGLQRHSDQQRGSRAVYEDLLASSPVALRNPDGTDRHTENLLEQSTKYNKQSVPSFTSDDEKASAILEPTINNCLARFDGLLGGLHRSLYYRNASNARSAKRKIPRSRRASRVEDSFPVLDDESTVQLTPSYSLKRQRVNTDCRDWSEVIAIASMASWDPDVISNAATRCASLFNESMEQRDAPRNGTAPSKYNTARTISPLHIDQRGNNVQGAQMGSQEQQISYPFGYRCPQVDCERHEMPYTERWALRQHLKRSHKHSIKEAEVIVADAIRIVKEQKTTLEQNQHLQPEDDILAPITITMPWSRQR